MTRRRRDGDAAIGPGRGARRAAFRWGLDAEGVAAWVLRLKGFRIEARRWRSPVGEIDLVARRGDLLIFVEVKARARGLDAVTALTPRQRQRIERAASAYLAARSRAPGRVRFDLMAVARSGWPVHLADAWRPAGPYV